MAGKIESGPQIIKHSQDILLSIPHNSDWVKKSGSEIVEHTQEIPPHNPNLLNQTENNYSKYRGLKTVGWYIGVPVALVGAMVALGDTQRKQVEEEERKSSVEALRFEEACGASVGDVQAVQRAGRDIYVRPTFEQEERYMVYTDNYRTKKECREAAGEQMLRKNIQ